MRPMKSTINTKDDLIPCLRNKEMSNNYCTHKDSATENSMPITNQIIYDDQQKFPTYCEKNASFDVEVADVSSSEDTNYAEHIFPTNAQLTSGKIDITIFNGTQDGNSKPFFTEKVEVPKISPVFEHSSYNQFQEVVDQYAHVPMSNIEQKSTNTTILQNLPDCTSNHFDKCPPRYNFQTRISAEQHWQATLGASDDYLIAKQSLATNENLEPIQSTNQHG